MIYVKTPKQRNFIRSEIRYVSYFYSSTSTVSNYMGLIVIVVNGSSISEYFVK